MARGWEQPLDPEVNAMRWMKEHQCSYMDMQLDFWLLLRPLTDGGKESSRHLTRRVLSIWHWPSALDPPVCPPVPSSLDIGHWLQEDHDVDDRQLWIEAYACALQCMAEASVGQFWTTVGKTMVLEGSNLVKTFMTATGMWITLHIIRQCWPTPREETPQQNLDGIWEVIVNKVDEVVTRNPSSMAWDRFAFLPTKEKHWQEEVQLHYPGKTLNVGTCMPGFQLMLQNEEGYYGIATHALKFEGHMIIYDPQRDISQWVPVRGTSATLTMSEIRVANNMNPFPYDGTGLVQPHQLHSPMLVQGIPVGEESDRDSFDKPPDSGEEWDKTKRGTWLYCSSLLLGEGPM